MPSPKSVAVTAVIVLVVIAGINYFGAKSDKKFSAGTLGAPKA